MSVRKLLSPEVTKVPIERKEPVDTSRGEVVYEALIDLGTPFVVDEKLLTA